MNEEEVEYCPACNREITHSNHLMYTECPYAQEMSSPGEYNHKEWMCSECYGDRVGDI